MTDAAPSMPYVDQPLRRREDIKFLPGHGRNVDDIKLPGMLYLAILRSPHAHALVTGVDLPACASFSPAPTSPARSATPSRIGMRGVLGRDPGSLRPQRRDLPPAG